MSDRMKMSPVIVCFKLTGSFAGLVAMVVALSLCARQGIRSLGGSFDTTAAGRGVSLDHWEVSVAVAFGLLAGIAGLWVIRQVAGSAAESQPAVALEARDTAQPIHADAGLVAGANSNPDGLQTSMRESVVSGGKISQIVNTMTALAFQTDLLALSARVEAAHGGEAGLGLAVAAREVRSPAQRSAGGAGGTAEMVSTSVAVKQPAVQVNGTGKVNYTGEERTQSLQQLAWAIAQMEQDTAALEFEETAPNRSRAR